MKRRCFERYEPSHGKSLESVGAPDATVEREKAPDARRNPSLGSGNASSTVREASSHEGKASSDRGGTSVTVGDASFHSLIRAARLRDGSVARFRIAAERGDRSSAFRRSAVWSSKCQFGPAT